MALPRLRDMYERHLKGEVTWEELRLATDEVLDDFVRRGLATPPELSHPQRPSKETPAA